MRQNIPVLHVQGESLADTYEKALMELWQKGTRFSTQYDKPDDPKSIDATMNLTVLDPMSDPMIHKAFPGGIEDLREYVMELEGAKDHWVKNLHDKEDKRWEYTYHGRFERYGAYKRENEVWDSVYDGGEEVNQFDFVVNKLSEQPFTRQAQMITWMTALDLNIYDPPCLQSWWGRILEDEEDGTWYLNYNMRIRSNDAWGANFMNMFGLTLMTKELIADKIAEKTGRTVKLGRMNWQADSWHVYGKDIQAFKERLIDRVSFIEEERVATLEDRVYNFNDEMIQEIYNEATPVIIEKIKEQDKKYL